MYILTSQLVGQSVGQVQFPVAVGTKHSMLIWTETLVIHLSPLVEILWESWQLLKEKIGLYWFVQENWVGWLTVGIV
jgi:hypothetical protein